MQDLSGLAKNSTMQWQDNAWCWFHTETQKLPSKTINSQSVKLLPWPNIFHQRLIIKDIALESTGNISLANRHMAFAVRSLQGGQPACSRTSMGLAVSSDVKTIQNQQNIQKKSKKQTTVCFSDFLLSNSKSVESCSSCQVAVRFPDGLLLPVQAIMHRVGGLMFCVWLVTAMSMHQSARERDEMWWCSNVANADYAYLSVSQWTPVLAERHHPSHASRNLRSEKRRMQSLWSIKVLWSLLQEQQAPRFLVNLFVHIHFEGCLSSQLTEFTLLRQEILEMFHFRWGWRFKTRSQPLFRLQWLQETLHKSQFFLLQCSEAAICLPCQSREEKNTASDPHCYHC